jgi:flagellin
MIINHNLSAMYANRTLKVAQRRMTGNIEKLSSGMRINSAGDDASGLAVSEKMRSQIRGLHQAQRNTQDGISFIQTTEGYLTETTEILQRVRELAIQSANGVYTNSDREQIQVEVSQLVDEVDRIAQSAQFNGLKMLQGEYARGAQPVTTKTGQTNEMYFHVGANENERFQVFIGTMNAEGLYLKDNTGKKVGLTTINGANKSIATVDEALRKIGKQRADLGAYQNRLEHVLKNTAVAEENTQAAESRIRDTDMAAEMMDFVRNQILNQSTVSMLAQANQKPQAVLQLLR